MAEKTLAEIARTAWLEAGNLEDHWEITAAAVRNAVIEECAKIADGHAKSAFGMTEEEAAAQNIAAALRALKEAPHG